MFIITVLGFFIASALWYSYARIQVSYELITLPGTYVHNFNVVLTYVYQVSCF